MAQQNKNEQQVDVNQLLKVRREKLADLQERGKDPFQITKYDVTNHTTAVSYTHLDVYKRQILLLVLFVGFIAWTVSYSLKERTEEDGTDEVIMLSKRKSAIFIVGGAIAIAVGGQVVVDSAKSLALAAGMSETLVGLTIVAMGTSLPELVTSAVAASKGEADLAIGNVVGSNLSNILLVLGLSAAILSLIHI